MAFDGAPDFPLGSICARTIDNFRLMHQLKVLRLSRAKVYCFKIADQALNGMSLNLAATILEEKTMQFESGATV